jgi:hypothetical protein
VVDAREETPILELHHCCVAGTLSTTLYNHKQNQICHRTFLGSHPDDYLLDEKFSKLIEPFFEHQYKIWLCKLQFWSYNTLEFTVVECDKWLLCVTIFSSGTGHQCHGAAN